MYGIVRCDDEHQVGDVCLGIATSSTCATFNVISGNHTRIDGGVGIIDTLHVACQEPSHDKGYHRQNDQIPTYLIQKPNKVSK